MVELKRAGKRDIPSLFLLYIRAFPPSERKPFGKILRMAREGRTDLWTIRKKGRFAGLASTVNSPEIVLLDYFAVKRSLRGRGVGSAALLRLEELYVDRGFFVEIESTREQAHNMAQRESRKRFYESCGMVPMGAEADVFGIRMELLGIRCHLEFDDYRAFYRDNYSPWAAEHINPVEDEV